MSNVVPLKYFGIHTKSNMSKNKKSTKRRFKQTTLRQKPTIKQDDDWIGDIIANQVSSTYTHQKLVSI